MALDRILFRAGATLRVVKGKGAPIPQKNLLAITIKEIRVDPRTFSLAILDRIGKVSSN